jgi:hypothetical protein
MSEPAPIPSIQDKKPDLAEMPGSLARLDIINTTTLPLSQLRMHPTYVQPTDKAITIQLLCQSHKLQKYPAEIE